MSHIYLTAQEANVLNIICTVKLGIGKDSMLAEHIINMIAWCTWCCILLIVAEYNPKMVLTVICKRDESYKTSYSMNRSKELMCVCFIVYLHRHFFCSFFVWMERNQWPETSYLCPVCSNLFTDTDKTVMVICFMIWTDRVMFVSSTARGPERGP